MAIYLKSKKFDLEAGKDLFILLHRRNAEDLGVKEGDIVLLGYRDVELYVKVIITDKEVQIGEVGLYEDIVDDYHIPEGSILLVDIPSVSKAIEAIKRKMSGHVLTEEELVEIMKDIGTRKLKETEVAFFVATFFSPGFTDEEIYYMTKGMAQSGEILDFKYIKGNKKLVVDKHSIGGIPGKGVSPVLISILASNGYVVPNTSTRAITSPAGTTDILECVMPVALNQKDVYRTVEKAGACMVWGGSLYLAPADDEIINVERSLRIQEFQKVLVSIVAKKIATGATFVLIDLPYGKGSKIEKPDDLDFLSREFEKLFEKFGIDCVTYKRMANGPDGSGIGPILEMKECLKILERDEKRSEDLEDVIVDMATQIFEHLGKVKKGEGKKLAQDTLDSGKALKKFWEIAKAQGATKEVKSKELTPGEIQHTVKANRGGTVKNICNRELVSIARALGTPKIKEAGIYIEKMPGDKVSKGDTLFTLYTTSKDRMEEGIKAVKIDQLYDL